MKVELGPLPYGIAVNIIKWCAANDVDLPKSMSLLEAMSVTKQDPDLEWSLEIPEEFVTFLLLKLG
jgi:hypothetical protein